MLRRMMVLDAQTQADIKLAAIAEAKQCNIDCNH